MTVIPNWKKAHRMFSVQIAALLLIWSGLGEAAQTAILQATGIPANVIPGVLSALIIAARLINQPEVAPDDPPSV
jgi:precorrin-4 methylase